jgi:hypothetical protein
VVVLASIDGRRGHRRHPGGRPDRAAAGAGRRWACRTRWWRRPSRWCCRWTGSSAACARRERDERHAVAIRSIVSAWPRLPSRSSSRSRRASCSTESRPVPRAARRCFRNADGRCPACRRHDFGRPLRRAPAVPLPRSRAHAVRGPARRRQALLAVPRLSWVPISGR